ncbi:MULTISPECIES: hypothetical protein [Gammaproteobacteria]|uniref:hypothetical protein n=1 Tax=Gammaproteobacteria TaxID=1236 RepID=UPI001ADAA3FF|nr:MULTISPECIES: hypothetical protein [Gammaproteobacteria]MBO9481972.1 hypothetical protein [Salinisphaera sp. G21_0]MBO9495008.1 hypothetical protein [Thalassotalea sp. G20_0]
MSSSLTDQINNRPFQPDPVKDPQIGPSVQAAAEDKVETSYTNQLTELPKMLEMDFDKVENLLANLSAANPFRPDMALGKQPEVAVIDASNSVQEAPVAPVGAAVDASQVSQLKQVNAALAEYDVRLQQVFDAMALSRSGVKPDLQNMGTEYERLMTFVRQTEYHLTQAIKLIPETLPENTGESMAQLMPEFSQSLVRYDSEFQQIFGAIQHELKQAEIASKRFR